MSLNFATARLTMTRITADDQALYCGLYSSPSIMRFIGEPIQGQALHNSWERAFKASQTAVADLCFWRVASKDRDQALGVCGFNRRKQQPLQADIGCLLLESCHGQGVATELLGGLSSYAFEHLAVDHLCSDSMQTNLASFHLMTKLGYAYHNRPISVSHYPEPVPGYHWTMDKPNWKPLPRSKP